MVCKKAFLFFFICLGVKNLLAQPQIQWEKTFGGSLGDMAVASVELADGSGYLIAGESASDPSGDKASANNGAFSADYWVVRIDTAQNMIWEKSYGGTGGESLVDIVRTRDGNFLLAGKSNSLANGTKTEPNRGSLSTRDFWIVKIDVDGNVLWDKTIGGDNNDNLWSIDTAIGGGYMLFGGSNSGTSGEKTDPNIGLLDFWIVKIDEDGNVVWDKTIGGSGSEECFEGLTVSDGYVLGGYSSSPKGSGDKTDTLWSIAGDYWVVKVDELGNIVWDKTYGGFSGDVIWEIEKAEDGLLFMGSSASPVSGNKTSTNIGNGDIWLVKTDDYGNQIWDKAYGGTATEEPFSLKKKICGDGYIILGDSYSDIGGNKTEAQKAPSAENWWMLEIDEDGNVLWDKVIGTLNDNNDDESPSLLLSRDGGFLLAGAVNSGIGGDKKEDSRGNFDFWIVKLGYSFKADFDVDPGCVNEVIEFNNTSDLHGETDSSLWNFGDGSTTNEISPEHIFNSVGEYDVMLTVSKDCSVDSTQQTIQIGNDVRIEVASDSVACLGSPYVLIAKPAFPSSVQWFDGSGLDSLVIYNDGEYWVSAMDSNNCYAEDSINILFDFCEDINSDLFIPNAFSPSVNEGNEYLKIYGLEKLQPFDFSLSIYDKMGKRVFFTTDKEQFWDGRFNGSYVSSNTYILTFEGTDKQTSKKISGVVSIQVL